MYEFIWFVGGAFIYKFLSTIFAMTQHARVFENLQIDVLTFLGTAAEDVAFIKALKYKIIEQTTLDAEQVKIARLRDEEFFEKWKKACIINIHGSAPNYVRLSFQNWEEAMALLDEFYGRRIHEEKQKQK